MSNAYSVAQAVNRTNNEQARRNAKHAMQQRQLQLQQAAKLAAKKVGK
jgi:hypothetical protein